MLSSGRKCYHLGWNVIIWNAILSSRANVLGRNFIIWDAMLSYGANVIIWDEMLSSGMKCYHLVIIWDEMLSSGIKCYPLGLMLSSGTKCNHLGWNVIIWDEMLSSGKQCYHLELVLSSGTKCYLELMLWYVANDGNVIIWCYHVMLSSGVITPPSLFFLQTSLTPFIFAFFPKFDPLKATGMALCLNLKVPECQN